MKTFEWQSKYCSTLLLYFLTTFPGHSFSLRKERRVCNFLLNHVKNYAPKRLKQSLEKETVCLYVTNCRGKNWVLRLTYADEEFTLPGMGLRVWWWMTYVSYPGPGDYNWHAHAELGYREKMFWYSIWHWNGKHKYFCSLPVLSVETLRHIQIAIVMKHRRPTKLHPIEFFANYQQHKVDRSGNYFFPFILFVKLVIATMKFSGICYWNSVLIISIKRIDMSRNEQKN